MAWRVPAAAGMFLLGAIAATKRPDMIFHGTIRAKDILVGGRHGLLPPRSVD
jgi:hypothetical protein